MNQGLRGWATHKPSHFVKQSSVLSADVTLTTQNVFYDGPTVTLSPGTWMLMGAVIVTDAGGAANVTAKLWDGGTSVLSSLQDFIAAGGVAYSQLNFHGIVTLQIITTYKISVTNDTRGTSGSIKAAANVNPAGNTASYLHAVRLH